MYVQHLKTLQDGVYNRCSAAYEHPHIPAPSHGIIIALVTDRCLMFLSLMIELQLTERCPTKIGQQKWQGGTQLPPPGICISPCTL